ncbi:MAG TPA: VWA domain-containing protein [Polyangiaceae bacterium]|nr:VWA domain-containing protein [Polyangiaceae bacterium]
MKFAHPIWLLGALFALLVAALFVWGGIGLARASRRFGDPDRMRELVTARAARRRAWKGVWVVLATALSFVALARPQYGRGTKLIPATNLDVVVVLDFSKSMYARDIAPSRIDRAKAEVARLIRSLPGARFGAVAFAGEPIGFPVTSDGAAIAQFFRQLEPNDMPVGGTAIARALARARELLASDPKSHDHSRVIMLVTDGEDLEGDPVAVARSAGEEGTTVHVVQIGGRTPERIPAVGPDGKMAGYRTDETGQPLTTALSAEGEAQLAQVASVAAGKIVRSERGTTGIDAIAEDLKRKMTEELAERVETVYADVYVYPLGAALLLLIAEVFLPESERRKIGAKRGANLASKPLAKTAAKSAATLGGLFLLAWLLAGCSFDPSRPFDRQAPEVKRAVAVIDAGEAGAAVPLLEEYLATGSCADGGFGVPEKVRQKPFASLDLGIALFHMGERFGRRFGEEERGGDAGPSPAEERLAELRNVEVECALRVVLAIANEADVPLELRARAQYLAGNLEFLRKGYQEAVRHYDESLKLIPGLFDAADKIGQNAAWNRAIALARIEDEKKRDAGSDGGKNDNDGGRGDSGPPRPDGSNGGQEGGGNDPHPDAGPPRPPPDAGPEPDAGNNSKKQDSEDAAPPPPQPPPSVNQDERMLDMLESAPTFQQQDAKNRMPGRKFRGSADK